MQPVEVKKGKTVVVPVSLGFNVSQDSFLSEIRVDINPLSALIATWAISFDTDGTDGELLLTLDYTITIVITQTSGYMDIKRVSGGPTVSILSDPLQVLFIDA